MRKFVYFLSVLLLMFNLIQARKLKVSNGKVLDESNNPIVLKGVNLPGLEWDSKAWFDINAIKEIAENWKANLVRLPLNQDFYMSNKNNYRQTVRDVVDWCKAYGLYIILDLHWVDAQSEQTTLPNSGSKDFWIQMAKDFNEDDNVLYDLFNEPYNVSWTQWKSYAESYIQEILKYDSDAIFVVGGTDWAYDLSQVASNPITSSSNVIYSTHHYPWKADANNGSYNSLFGRYPILIGEFGYWNSSTQPPAYPAGDLAFVQGIINNVNSKEKGQAHYAAWSFHTSATPTLITESVNFTRTDQGNVVYNDCRSSNLQKYIDRSNFVVKKALFGGNYIGLEFNKPVSSSISKSNFSLDGFNIESVDITDLLGYKVAITVDKPLDYSNSYSLNISGLDDKYNYSSINGSVDLQPNLCDLPLKVNVGEYKSTDIPSIGFVAEQPFVKGLSAWGTEWYDVHGAQDHSALHSDYWPDHPEYDPLFDIDMYGFKALRANVENGTYIVTVFCIEDKTIGPTDNKFGYHAFHGIFEGDTLIKNFDAYLETGEKYRAAITSREVEVKDGRLDLEFVGISDYPLISGIYVGKTNEYGHLAIKNNSLQKDFNMELYPNPFNPTTTVQLTGIINKNSNLYLYDVNGKLLLKKEIKVVGNNSNIKIRLDMSKFSSGVYYIRVSNGAKIVQKKAILLK